MIPEEDEERLKTEYETGKKFYDNYQQVKKEESLAEKLKENQIKKRIFTCNKSNKKNFSSLFNNFSKEEKENSTINLTNHNKQNEISYVNHENNFQKNSDLLNKIKSSFNKKSITPKGDLCKNESNFIDRNKKINYNDVRSIKNFTQINNLYSYNYSININGIKASDQKDSDLNQNHNFFLKKSNSEIFGNESPTNKISKLDLIKPINNKDNSYSKKLNLFHSKSENFDIIQYNNKDNNQNKSLNKDSSLKRKNDLEDKEEIIQFKLKRNNYNPTPISNRLIGDIKNLTLNVKNNKNNNCSNPELGNYEKLDFQNSFDQISEISIKNNTTLNTNYNMSPDKEKTLNESIFINQDSKEKIQDRNLNQENNDLKSIIDYINKKQIEKKKIINSSLKIKDENKGNVSKNSSINMNYQNNTNNSNSAYSKKNTNINSKNIDSVDTDVSILNFHLELNNKSKLSIKQIKDIKLHETNHLNILKLSKIMLNDEINSRENTSLNKINIYSKNLNGNSSQNENLYINAKNNSFYKKKTDSSLFHSRIRVNSYINSKIKINVLEKENNSSFGFNNFNLNISNKEMGIENNKINESQDVLNHNFDFNELKNDENDNLYLNLKKRKNKIPDIDVTNLKFPIFTCESTRNRKNNSNLLHCNMNMEIFSKDMKLPLINNCLNKSAINNDEFIENKNYIWNKKINIFNNSNILKDKSFLKSQNFKNNSSLISNKNDNLNSNFEEEVIDPLEKDKMIVLKTFNIKNNTNSSLNLSIQNLNGGKIFSTPFPNEDKLIFEKSKTLERVHSNEGKTNFLIPIKNKINSTTKYNNNLKVLNKNSVNLFPINKHYHNTNEFILKKDLETDKNRLPIKIFNNLKVMDLKQDSN